MVKILRQTHFFGLIKTFHSFYVRYKETKKIEKRSKVCVCHPDKDEVKHQRTMKTLISTEKYNPA